MSRKARASGFTRLLTTSLLVAMLGTVAACQSSQDGPSRTVGQVTDDVAIRTAVVSRLLADPQVAGMQIKTEVYRGVVTLFGPVPDEATRGVALALVRDVKGVVRIDDRLTIVAP